MMHGSAPDRPWWDRLFQALASVIYGVGILGITIFTIGLGEAISGWGGALLFLPISIALFWLSVALHEFGHALAAHLTGSHPFAVVVMRVGFWRQRRGWRLMLLPRGQGNPLGYMMAFPGTRMDPVWSCRWSCAGGPIASLLAMSAGLAADMASDSESIEAASLMFATSNLTLALVTLLPYTSKHYESDALQILRGRGGVVADEPMSWVMRLSGRCIEGVQAQYLPADELDALERSDSMAGPLLAGWFRVVAARNVGDWQRAVNVADALHTIVDALPEGSEREAWRRQLLPTFAEAEGCRAFAASDATPLEDWIAEHGSMLANVAGSHLPAQLPRLKAQASAMRGYVPSARRWLALSEYHAERSFDLSTRTSEFTLRSRIEALMRQAADHPANTYLTSASDSANR